MPVESYDLEDDPYRHRGRPCRHCVCRCNARKRHDRGVCRLCALSETRPAPPPEPKSIEFETWCLMCARQPDELRYVSGDLRPRCPSCGGTLYFEAA